MKFISPFLKPLATKMKIRGLWKQLLIFVFIISHHINIAYAQEKTEAPKLSDSKSYTWIILPDLQNYQKFERNQPIFQIMVNWIKDQRSNLNIQMVLCVGDLVDRGNILSYGDKSKGDQSAYQQWHAVTRAFSKLNGIVPYILCTGNHDYGQEIAENRYSQFNSYFPPQFNPSNYELLVEMDENAQGVKTLENACYEWTSPLNQKYLLFSLEFAPRNDVLKWAREVSSREEYHKHIGVVLTHSYIDTAGRRVMKNNYPLKEMNSGEEIWKELIKQSCNIRFVFSGHICNSDAFTGQVGYSSELNECYKIVHQMLFNAQRVGGGHWGNGGDGWLRILEFLPDKRTLKVSTFSPLFYISPSTRDLSWRHESYDEFILKY